MNLIGAAIIVAGVAALNVVGYRLSRAYAHRSLIVRAVQGTFLVVSIAALKLDGMLACIIAILTVIATWSLIQPSLASKIGQDS